MKEKTTVILVSIVALALLSGCATKGKIGDGKLEPAAKAAVKLGAAAAGVATPEYAGAIKAAGDKLFAATINGDRSYPMASAFALSCSNWVRSIDGSRDRIHRAPTPRSSPCGRNRCSSARRC